MSSKKIVVFIFVIILVIFSILVFKYKKLFNNPLDSNKIVTGISYKSLNIKIGNKIINVQISDTPEKWSQGLSDRKSLGDSSGMLFVFPQKSPQVFWMKDMFFPLDFIWIDDGKIVKIDENVPNQPTGTPESQLPLYSSGQPVNYVLEVNAGFTTKNNIKVGDTLDLSSLNN